MIFRIFRPRRLPNKRPGSAYLSPAQRERRSRDARGDADANRASRVRRPHCVRDRYPLPGELLSLPGCLIGIVLINITTGGAYLSPAQRERRSRDARLFSPLTKSRPYGREQEHGQVRFGPYTRPSVSPARGTLGKEGITRRAHHASLRASHLASLGAPEGGGRYTPPGRILIC